MAGTTLSHLLLDWYARNGRELPWRVKGGAHPNPYVIFVSEIMLQQTTVKTVLPYFERFMKRFPNIHDLAAASEDEVYRYWQGLGYYSRARSLWQTAKKVVSKYNGKFPQTVKEIAKLKGFGPYTVASFSALAYNLPTTVVDGNVIRIICRMYHLTESVDTIKEKIYARAERLSDKNYPADYASAIMDLGAMICTPKKPQCLLCPWQKACKSFGKSDIENIPNRHKIAKREISGFVYVIRNEKGEFFLRKRTEKGLLSGLYEFPWSEDKIFSGATDTGYEVTHIFTHIRMKLRIYGFIAEKVDINGEFVAADKLSEYALSTLMKKVWQKINPAHF